MVNIKRAVFKQLASARVQLLICHKPASAAALIYPFGNTGLNGGFFTERVGSFDCRYGRLGTTGVTILLTDLQGRTVAKIEVAGRYGSQGWSTEAVDAGVYFYKVKFFGGESSMSKLVIIK